MKTQGVPGIFPQGGGPPTALLEELLRASLARPPESLVRPTRQAGRVQGMQAGSSWPAL